MTAIAVYVLCGTATRANTREYLCGGEAAAIGLGSAAAYGVGLYAKHFDSTAHIRWSQPSGIERRLQYALGGQYHAGKTNFLDSDIGSAITPAFGLITVGLADLAWPQGDRKKTFVQDQFLMWSGLVATKGLTDLTKGLFRRTRPAVALEPDIAPQGMTFRYSHQSFFSGHASSAFFSMAFANMRLRSIMGTKLSPGDYRSWRWAPPAVLFSWATYVGWSRLHSFKHYITDVAVGALAGWLMAELFHSFGDDFRSDHASDSHSTTLVRVQFAF